jgi:hypothetical protein
MMIGGKWARKETTGCNLSETGSKLARPMGVVGAAVAAEVMATATWRRWSRITQCQRCKCYIV